MADTAVIIPEQLKAKASELSIPESLSADLLAAYAPHAQAGTAIKEKIAAAPAVSPSFAREMRLAMVKVRTGADKTRKALKADSLLRSRAIDGLSSMIEMEAIAVERQMEDIEKAAERAEAARVARLRADRLATIGAYVTDASVYPVEKMDDRAFAELSNSLRLAYEAREKARVEAEAKAEADRIAAEAARAEAERARQIEVAMLREAADAARRKAAEEESARREVEAKAAAERRASEEAAAKERARADAELRAERERAAKIEAERRAEEDAKARAEEEKRATAERASAAPDAEKIRALSETVRAIVVPALSGHRAAQHAQIVTQRDKFATWLVAMAQKLEG
jgi:hypothetical protein